MYEVSRADFLRVLDSVAPGLSPADVYEQSSCFVFRNGEVTTFNREVRCVSQSGLPDGLEAAVPAKPLREALDRLPGETLLVGPKDGKFEVRADKDKVRLLMEPNIGLDTSSVAEPKAWQPLPPDFADALRTVQDCANKKLTDSVTCCVHFHPKWVEATDKLQACRYRLKLPLSRPYLVKVTACKAVSATDPTEVGEVSEWLHFRNPAGLRVSVASYVDQYDDLDGDYDIPDGTPLVLPKSLAAAVKVASLAGGEDREFGRIGLKLRDGVVFVKATGSLIETRGKRKCDYDGPEVECVVHPGVLANLIDKHSECVLGGDRILVKGGKWRYVVALEPPKKSDAAGVSTED